MLNYIFYSKSQKYFIRNYYTYIHIYISTLQLFDIIALNRMRSTAWLWTCLIISVNYEKFKTDNFVQYHKYYIT